MKAVVLSSFGGPDVLELGEVPDPTPGPGELLIQVAAAGVNRADISQREGRYPPPPGAPDWLGLEVSGVVVERGAGVTGFAIGDRVCALLSGGGYAELVAVPAGQVLPVPGNIDLIEAAGLVEVACTVWSNVFLLGDLRRGEVLLVHGGSSGIGTMAIQLGVAFGARVAVTAGSADKLAACEALGAEIMIDYKTEDFVARIKSEAGGAHVILDSIGGSYLDRNVSVLRLDGHILNIGNLSGESGTLNLGTLMMKRGTIHGTSLRARSAEAKAAIVASVRENVWPLVARGAVRPIIHSRVPLADAADAHRLLESSAHIGKVLLTVTR